MSEFFLELFSEEIPAGLQKSLRKKYILEMTSGQKEFLQKNQTLVQLQSPSLIKTFFLGI